MPCEFCVEASSGHLEANTTLLNKYHCLQVWSLGFIGGLPQGASTQTVILQLHIQTASTVRRGVLLYADVDLRVQVIEALR